MSKKILVIEDEAKIADICQDYLASAGFEVLRACDGVRGLDIAHREHPDLIILDLMLPGMDGWDVCRELRRESNVPIIMLTARVEEADKLIGLELGADDYVTKPFSPRELVARVRALLRRVNASTPPRILRAGDLTLDRDRLCVILAEREIPLTPTEFDLLFTLASHPGRIFSRTQLLTSIRGVAFESYERAIDSHVRNLRRKIESSGDEHRYIVSVYGVGYKFVERSK